MYDIFIIKYVFMLIRDTCYITFCEIFVLFKIKKTEKDKNFN